MFLVGVRAPLHAAGYVLFGVSLAAAAWETGAIALRSTRADGLGASLTPMSPRQTLHPPRTRSGVPLDRDSNRPMPPTGAGSA
jgi:hypothetical protein